MWSHIGGLRMVLSGRFTQSNEYEDKKRGSCLSDTHPGRRASSTTRSRSSHEDQFRRAYYGIPLPCPTSRILRGRPGFWRSLWKVCRRQRYPYFKRLEQNHDQRL